jgi:hypothetical protein
VPLQGRDLTPCLRLCRSPADKGGAGVNITIPVVGVPASVGAAIVRSKRIDLLWDVDELPVTQGLHFPRRQAVLFRLCPPFPPPRLLSRVCLGY